MSELAAAEGIHPHHPQGRRPLAARADPQRLRQVLINLPSDAVKNDRHGGTVTVGYRPCGPQEIKISVTETGLGLSPAELERIFVPFDRLHAERSGIEGTGIGQHPTRGLTEAMSGRIRVTSRPGSGSTFTAVWPTAIQVEPDDQRQLGGNMAISQQSSGTLANVDSFLVLYIEDNAANRNVIERFFSGSPGIAPQTAATGQAGVELFVSCRPDLVLLDLYLPDLNGDEVCTRLRTEALTKETPIVIVIVSADATHVVSGRMLTRGVDGYPTKPLDLRQFQNIVEALRRKKKRTGSAAVFHDPSSARAKAAG